MSNKAQATRFLAGFHAKMKVFDILYLDDRGKNSQTLALLEISPMSRRKVLEDLGPEDYSQGPLAESDYGGGAEMWVFGKEVKRQEIYIKITMGFPGAAVICISFHVAEYPMKYPFKASTS